MTPPTPTRINEDGEVEKLCGRCGEWWPFDDEFFIRSSKGKLRSPCRACVIEIRHEIATRPCNVPGCPNPRYGRTSAYCREHHYTILLRREPPKRAYRKAVKA